MPRKNRNRPGAVTNLSPQFVNMPVPGFAGGYVGTTAPAVYSGFPVGHMLQAGGYPYLQIPSSPMFPMIHYPGLFVPPIMPDVPIVELGLAGDDVSADKMEEAPKVVTGGKRDGKVELGDPKPTRKEEQMVHDFVERVGTIGRRGPHEQEDQPESSMSPGTSSLGLGVGTISPKRICPISRPEHRQKGAVSFVTDSTNDAPVAEVPIAGDNNQEGSFESKSDSDCHSTTSEGNTSSSNSSPALTPVKDRCGGLSHAAAMEKKYKDLIERMKGKYAIGHQGENREENDMNLEEIIDTEEEEGEEEEEEEVEPIKPPTKKRGRPKGSKDSKKRNVRKKKQ